jgi:flagellar protein FlaG
MPIQPITGTPPALSSFATDRPVAAAAPATPAAQAAPQAAQVEQAVQSANQALKQRSQNLEFSIDEGSGRTVTRLVDQETNTVIRQFPSEEMLNVARELDRFQGLLIKQKA